MRETKNNNCSYCCKKSEAENNLKAGLKANCEIDLVLRKYTFNKIYFYSWRGIFK